MKRRDLIGRALATGSAGLVGTVAWVGGTAGDPLLASSPQPDPHPPEGRTWSQWIKVRESLQFRLAGRAGLEDPDGPWPEWFVSFDGQPDPTGEVPEWVIAVRVGETGHLFIETATPDTTTWWNLGFVRETRFTTRGHFNAAGKYQEHEIVSARLVVGVLANGEYSVLRDPWALEELRGRLMTFHGEPSPLNPMVHGKPGDRTQVSTRHVQKELR